MFPDLTGNFSSIINMVPGSDKMFLLPLKKGSPVPLPAGPPYLVQFNPESFDESMDIMYNQEQPIGATQQHQHYHLTKPRTFSFEFLIDGTGASGDKREVIAEIELFKKTVEFKGDQHKPSFILMVWGTHVVLSVLKSLKIKYTLFRKNGTPLRAILNATFCEHTERIEQVIAQGLLSPDLSSTYTVKEGDTLPRMCLGVYDTPRHYLEVAKANGLTNFRKLSPGLTLDFPPVSRD